jgi:hypothetical protein
VLAGLVSEQEAAGSKSGASSRLSLILEPAAAALVACEQAHLAPTEVKRMLIIDAGGCGRGDWGRGHMTSSHAVLELGSSYCSSAECRTTAECRIKAWQLCAGWG